MAPALTLAAALLAASGAPAAGRVDWAGRVVACSGAAAPTLQEETENATVTRGRTARAARDRAARACLEALRAVTTSATETVGARLDRDPALATAVEAVLRGARPRPPLRLFADGGVAVELAVPLDGELGKLLGPLAPRAEPPPPAAPR